MIGLTDLIKTVRNLLLPIPMLERRVDYAFIGSDLSLSSASPTPLFIAR